MKSGNRPCYHCFLLLSGWNLLAFYLFIGGSRPAPDKQPFLSDPLFNYFFFVSLSLLLTWFTYFLCRKYLVSKRVMALHFLITALITIPLPWILTHLPDNSPHGYLDQNSATLTSLLEGHTHLFIGTVMLLLLSDLLLLVNIRKSNKRIAE